MNLWVLWYRLRDAREGIARNIWASAAAALIIGLALLAFGSFSWLNTGLAELASLLQQQVQIRVFVAASADVEQLADRVAALDGVEQVQIVPAEVTYRRLASVFSGQADLRSAFPENPFPDSLAVSATDAETASVLSDRLREMEGVDEVIWGQGLAEPLFRMAENLRRLGTVLSFVFLAAALLVTTVALHMTLLIRAKEIRIQQWMGVSPWGIRSQFMLEGFLLGLFSAVLSAFAFVWLAEGARNMLVAILPLGGGFADPVASAVLMMLAGPSLGFLGGLTASQRIVRKEGEG